LVIIYSISSWADKIKEIKRVFLDIKLHYIDILECNRDIYDKNIIDKYCNNKCITASTIKDFLQAFKI
jgi:hypothetical protein